MFTIDRAYAKTNVHKRPKSPDALRYHFWGKVDVRGRDECWEWQASKITGGYGQFAAGGLAHRIALELFLGRPLAEGKQACHRCDNRGCCNPFHLFEGSPRENMLDAMQKARVAHGENHYAAKLDAAMVRDIRLLLAEGRMTRTAIAEKFGVSRMTVYRIANNRNWSHLT